jgi:hypothetical protein
MKLLLAFTLLTLTGCYAGELADSLRGKCFDSAGKEIKCIQTGERK